MLGLFVARVADFYWALGSLMADRTLPQGLLDQISLERLFADIHGLKSRGQFDELDAQSPKDLLGEQYLARLGPSLRTYIYKPLRCWGVEVIYGDCDEKVRHEAATFWSAVVGSPVVVHSIDANGKHMDMIEHPVARARTAELLDQAVSR